VDLQVGKGGKLTQYPELAGQAVVVLVEDREGTVWVATLNGLDRFRDFTVATLTVRQGLSSARVNSVLANSEGGVWLATAGGLNRWNNGLITFPRTGTAKQDGKLNGRAPESLFQDDRGRIWISTSRGVGYLANNRFILISGVPGGLVSSITEDTEGNVWIANLDHGLFRVSLQSQVQQIPWAVLGRKDFATALAADRLHGGLWLGFVLGGVAYFGDGQVRASYSVGDWAKGASPAFSRLAGHARASYAHWSAIGCVE
jgi:ligand-binding sensor domain-containing protein